MRYRIGEIANLLNLSPQSLRKYESEGLICPQKDENSAYRSYSGWDLILLSACRQYRSLDFSLNETNLMLMCDSPEDVTRHLRHHEEVLTGLIAEYTQKKNTLTAWRTQLEQVNAIKDQFSIEQSEDTYCLVYQKGDQLLQDSDLRILLSEWYSYIPYVYCSLQLPVASFPHELNDYSVSLCLSAQALPFLGITDTSHLQHFPKRKSLHSAMIMTQDSFDRGEPYRIIWDYAQAHNLQLDESSSFFCRLNLIYKGDSGLRFFVDCYAALK